MSRHIGHRFMELAPFACHPDELPWYMMTIMPKFLSPCILSDESDRSKNNRRCTPIGVPSS